MKLYYAGTSPYVRKVVVMAMETGLEKKIERVPTSVVPTQPNRDLAKDNPLMKLPTLITDDGMPLYDSYVICDYLDSLHKGEKLIPPSGPARWNVLRIHALASGLTDAGILSRYENMFHEEGKRSEPWLQGQFAKINQGLDELENEVKHLAGPLTLAQIATGCSIGWLEFRKPTGDIRQGRPKLMAWYDEFVKRPSMQATMPKA